MMWGVVSEEYQLRQGEIAVGEGSALGVVVVRPTSMRNVVEGRLPRNGLCSRRLCTCTHAHNDRSVCTHAELTCCYVKKYLYVCICFTCKRARYGLLCVRAIVRPTLLRSSSEFAIVRTSAFGDNENLHLRRYARTASIYLS